MLARISVSIHTPLAGCDIEEYAERRLYDSFNPHTPRGVRHSGHYIQISYDMFQSTHPSRGATKSGIIKPMKIRVSIHTPLAGCDYLSLYHFQLVGSFNPHTPRGVRRQRHDTSGGHAQVSIHTPLAGCDIKFLYSLPLYICFNPHTPRGVRLG